MNILSNWQTVVLKKLDNLKQNERYWLLRDIGAPFAISRLALTIAAWFSQYFSIWSLFRSPIINEREWNKSPYKLIDMWVRWDSDWYLTIIRQGYQVDHYKTEMSNIAFSPLYPYLIKILLIIVPPGLRSDSIILLIGVILSNAFTILALVLLYKLVQLLFQNKGTARRTIWYTLLFPASFFLSSFYTESIFFLLCIASFYAALKEKWVISSLLACLLALSRLVGILIIIPLAWIYFEKLDWKLLKIRKDVLWFSIIPVGLFAFLIYSYNLTGDFLAPFHAHSAWGRVFTSPLNPILEPAGWDNTDFIIRVDHVLAIGGLALSILSFFLLPSPSFGIFSLIIIIIPLTTGTLISMSRFLSVAFPIFIVLAVLGRWRWLDQIIWVLFLSMQALFMAAWMRFYWVA